MLGKELELKKTPAEYAEAYRSFERKVNEAYDLLEQASEIYRSCFAETYLGSSPLPKGSYSSPNVERAREIVLADMKGNAWVHILKIMGVDRLVTKERWYALYDTICRDKKMEDGSPIPDITQEEIIKVYQAFVMNSNELMLENVKGVFDYLTPGSWRMRYNDRAYKSDSARVNEMVILEGVYHNSTKQKGWNYNSKQKLKDVDRLFHILDGNMEAFNDGLSYVSPLVDGISNTEKGETDYFRWKRYKNGNLHLYFKRVDLVRELNRLATDKTILERKN